MISLTSVKNLTTNSLGRTGLILSKKSPEILLGIGVVGVVVGTVLACRATLKATKIIEEGKETLDAVNHVREQQTNEAIYSEADYKRDIAITYVKTGAELVKLYMPAIAVTGISIALIIGSHNILSKRNAAIAAAYKLMESSYQQYRERVRAEYGDEIDRKLRFGEKEVKGIETTAKGKEKEVTKKVLDNKDIAPYSFIFSEETATQYKRDWGMNYNLLKSYQNYANDRLRIRGHIFLNEILDDLGLERTKPGVVVGWVKGYNVHNPDNAKYVDFGLDDPVNEQLEDQREAMIQPWYLNFNVDGNIHDLI